MSGVVTQFSITGAMLAGCNSSKLKGGEVIGKNNFGLGTFNNLDGEMLLIDGKIYCCKRNGKAHIVNKDKAHIPFATFSHFNPQKPNIKREKINFDDFEEKLKKDNLPKNMVCGIWLEGFFYNLKMRTACKIKANESLLVEEKIQSNFEFKKIKGIMIGFYFPNYMPSINVPGIHLHFLSDCRTIGGHVINFSNACFDFNYQIYDTLKIIFSKTEEFNMKTIDVDPTEALNRVERKR